nr:hypothetical protein [uncultured Duganella sp.]
MSKQSSKKVVLITAAGSGIGEATAKAAVSPLDVASEANMNDFVQFGAGKHEFAIEQPADVDASEIVVRPTASPY